MNNPPHRPPWYSVVKKQNELLRRQVDVMRKALCALVVAETQGALTHSPVAQDIARKYMAIIKEEKPK